MGHLASEVFAATNRWPVDALTAKAIKFIKELVLDEHDPVAALLQERQREQRRNQARANAFGRLPPKKLLKQAAETCNVQPKDYGDLLDELLSDDGSHWTLNDPKFGNSTPSTGSEVESHESTADIDYQSEAARGLPDNWSLRNSFIVSLLKPQIELNSDVSFDTTLVVTALSVQLRSFSVVDDNHADDPVNALVMHRNFGSIDTLQAWYPHLKGWRSGRRSYMLSHATSVVPPEVLSGYCESTSDLDIIVPATSARLRYDKYNRLRLAKNATDNGSASNKEDCRNSMDRMMVDCERFSVSATPTHYGAMYEVISSLILYTDPSQKARTSKIEKLVLSKDFSDRYSIANQVKLQQDELRSLLNAYNRDSQRAIESMTEEQVIQYYYRVAEIQRSANLLTLWMGAIQTAQDSSAKKQTMGMQMDAKAREIVWHMREEHGTPLMKVAVQRVQYRWLNSSDGTTSNAVVIGDLHALNSSPEQYFSEIISKYIPPSTAHHRARQDIFAALVWSALSPVGGVPIIDRFEVHLHPINLQLEAEIGKKIQHYIFAQRHARKVTQGDSVASVQSPEKNRLNGMQSLHKTRSIESLASTRRSQDVPSSAASWRSNGTTLASSASLQVPESTTSTSGTYAPRPRILHRLSSGEMLALSTSKSDDYLDAEEMRHRARLNRAFLHVELFPTIICVSFKVGYRKLVLTVIDMWTFRAANKPPYPTSTVSFIRVRLSSTVIAFGPVSAMFTLRGATAADVHHCHQTSTSSPILRRVCATQETEEQLLT